MRSVQSHPVQPGANSQCVFPTHSPCAPPPLGQAPSEHDAPVKLASQTHVPLKHLPLPEQSSGQRRLEQSWSVHPSKHSHRSSMHWPWPEHSP